MTKKYWQLAAYQKRRVGSDGRLYGVRGLGDDESLDLLGNNWNFSPDVSTTLVDNVTDSGAAVAAPTVASSGSFLDSLTGSFASLFTTAASSSAQAAEGALNRALAPAPATTTQRVTTSVSKAVKSVSTKTGLSVSVLLILGLGAGYFLLKKKS